ncbi:MAG TPA: hypothetical protein VGE45_10675 [Chloroflexia bacterium]
MIFGFLLISIVLLAAVYVPLGLYVVGSWRRLHRQESPWPMWRDFSIQAISLSVWWLFLMYASLPYLGVSSLNTAPQDMEIELFVLSVVFLPVEVINMLLRLLGIGANMSFVEAVLIYLIAPALLVLSISLVEWLILSLLRVYQGRVKGTKHT